MIYQPTPKMVQETDVTPAAVLDFTEVQTFLRLDGTTDQSLVNSLIEAVTKKIEDYTGRKFITQVWSVYYDFFPKTSKEEAWWDGVRDGAISELYAPIRFLELPFGPCQSAYFVKTYDESDAASTFDASLYKVEQYSANPKVSLKSGGTWPSGVLRPTNGIQVKATFGYGSTGASVPAPIREAIKIMVAKLYEHRGDEVTTDAIPKTAQVLLENYRTWRL